MDKWKVIRLIIYTLAIIIAAILALKFAPWVAAPLAATWYFTLVCLIYLLLFINSFLFQLQKHWRNKYKSYLDKDNSLKKKLLLPTGQEIKDSFIACFTLSKYLFLALALGIVFYLNYLMTYYPQGLLGLPKLLFDYDETGNLVKSNVWLAVSSLCVLFLCLVIMRQNHHIKLSSKLSSRQNLIINAHSNIALAKLRIVFTDMNRMFLASNKLEYILNAKPVAAIAQPKGQSLLNFRVNLKLNNDYSVTEFYIRQFSIFVEDMAIECDNYQNKFYQIFAVDNEFVLNFYIRFTDTDPQKLAEKFTGAEQIKLYYNFVVKNSFSVITDVYGSAIYEQAEELGTDNLCYMTKDIKTNQYYYI